MFHVIVFTWTLDKSSFISLTIDKSSFLAVFIVPWGHPFAFLATYYVWPLPSSFPTLVLNHAPATCNGNEHLCMPFTISTSAAHTHTQRKECVGCSSALGHPCCVIVGKSKASTGANLAGKSKVMTGVSSHRCDPSQ